MVKMRKGMLTKELEGNWGDLAPRMKTGRRYLTQHLLRLREDRLHHIPMHIGESKITSGMAER